MRTTPSAGGGLIATPCAAKVSISLATVAGYAERSLRPFSMALMVDAPTPLSRLRSARDQSSRARAARSAAGVSWFSISAP